MNKYIAILLMTLGWYTVSAQDSTFQFSLQECVDYGIKNHTAVENAILDSDGADRRIKETIGFGLPQINGKLEIIDNLEVQKFFIPNEGPFGDTSLPSDAVFPVAFGVQYSGNANITLSQMIFDGSYFVGIQASRAYKELMRKNILKSKTDVAESVTKAYYLVLVGTEQKANLSQNLSTLDSLLRDTKVMYDNGFVEKLDLQRLQVQRNNLAIEINKIERLNETSLQLLKFQMGMSLSSTLTVKETLKDFESKLGGAGASSANYGSRIEYQILETSLELQRLDKKNNKVTALPKLNAFAQLGWNAGQNDFGEMVRTSNWQNYGLIGFNLNVPIFSGFIQKHRVAQSQVAIDKAENDLKLMERTIDLQVAQYNAEFQNALGTLDNYKDNVELAEEVYKTTKIKYKEGVGTNLEVIEAESAMKQAKISYNAAIYDALVARLNLDKSTGKFISE